MKASLKALIALLLWASPVLAQDSQPPPQLAATITGDSYYTIYNNSQFYIGVFDLDLPNVFINRVYAPPGWTVEVSPDGWRPGRRATAVSWYTEDFGSMIPPSSQLAGFNLVPGNRRRAPAKYILGSWDFNIWDAGDMQVGKISAPSN